MATAAICATREVSWAPSYYRGEQWDPDLGLYYLRARYYNPTTGRFMSRDPYDGDFSVPGTLHKYLFAGDDPVNRADPAGMDYAESVRIQSNVSTSSVVISGLQAASAAVACALIYEGTNSYAQTVAGASGTVVRVSPCLAVGVKYPARPLPVPISTPADPNWPQKKFDDCQEIDDQIQSIKKIIRAIGGACEPGMTAAELTLRA